MVEEEGGGGLRWVYKVGGTELSNRGIMADVSW